MGRLNYTNRKNEGLKLGQVVAKDLAKRIPPNTGSKAALRDPVVELDVTGKDLGSEGFLEVAAALVTSTHYKGEHGKVVRLEELCLRDNGLDASCLRSLGKVVSLAADDLRDLDLSNNLITISTDDEAAAWQTFLTSFSKCHVLRRIDLSGNALGPRAFELLARLYGNESPVDLDSVDDADLEQDIAVPNLSALTEGTRRFSIASDSEDYTSDLEGASHVTKDLQNGSRPEIKSPEIKSPEKTAQAAALAERQAVYALTRGLRSVPYIILSDTAMTETCALYLSYVVACHNMPDQLLTCVPAAKAGPPAQQLSAYDSEPHCHGIVYLPNSKMGNAGLKVLELSEMLRIGLLDDFTHQELPDTPGTLLQVSSTARRASEARSIPTVGAAPNRRRSVLVAVSGYHEGQETASNTKSDLDRARSRIQGNTLRDAGPKCNDLWRVALKMLSLSRSTCLLPRQKRPYTSTGHPEEVSPSAMPAGQILSRCKISREQLDFPALPTLSPKPLRPSRTITAPLSTGNPNHSFTPRFHHYQNGTLTFLTPIPTPPPSTATCPPTPPPFPPQDEDTYRSSLPAGFSPGIWRRIIASAVGADQIMSEAQQRSVLRWGMDRGTLNRERESLGLAEHAQIWRVLEGTGCLAHEVNA